MQKLPFPTLLAGLALAATLGCNGAKTDAAPGSGTTTPAASGGGGAAGAGPRTLADNNGVDPKGDTIKVGVIGSLTGDQKPWGEDSIEGAKMALGEFNAEGGLDGKKVEMVVGDSGSKADVAKTAAEKVLSDGVVALVGEVASGHTIQMAKAAKATNVPVIAIGATKTDLTNEGGHVFRVCYTDAFQGPAVAKFAKEDLGKSKVAIVTDQKQPYSQGLSKDFADAFKKMGGEIVGEVQYETGQSDFSGIITQLKSMNPDALFLSGYFAEVGPMAQQIRKAGIGKDVPLLGGDGWDSPQLLISGGDGILGSYFCNHYNARENRPAVTEFLAKWKKLKGGEPQTTMAALGYDAMKLTLDAMKRAKSANSKKIIEALDQTENFPGVSGTITLKGGNGNPLKNALIVEVRPKSEGFQVFRKSISPSDIK